MSRTHTPIAILLALIASVLLGCARHTRTAADAPRPPADPLLVQEAINASRARAASLSTLWARHVTRVTYPDEQGKSRTDQIDGHINFRTPRGVVLTFMKAGELGGVLGSDDERYWWVQTRDPKGAWTGRHDLADPQRATEFGLPILPLDLIALAGLAEVLPQGQSPLSAHAGSSPSSVVLHMQLRDGLRVVELDARTGEPSSVEILDDLGRLVARSRLSGYIPVRNLAGGATVRVPGNLVLTFAAGQRAELWISEPEMGGRRPNPAAFDLERWCRDHNVRDLTDLDAPRAGGP